MPNKILIVESPNKIKKLKKILGTDWTVHASVGHIADLAIGIGIDGLGIKDFDSFTPIYKISKQKKNTVRSLKGAIANKEIYLAMDPDREGEAIANNLKYFLKLKNYKRVTFNEISEKAVLEAIAKPRSNDEDLIKAQETRRIIDRVYGFKGSGIIRRYSNALKSVGRVQSSGLKIVVDRERKINDFETRNYIEPQLEIDGNIYKLSGVEKEKIITTNWKDVTFNDSIDILEVNKEDKKVSPAKPLTTNAALKLGSSLGYSAGMTTKYLQSLFEVGLITYIRSDSPNLSYEFKEEAKEFLKLQNFEANISRKYKLPEGAQEGHEAIRPVHIDDTGKNIANDQERTLYEEIRRITLASLMKDGVDSVQNAEVILNGYTFKNTSKTIKEMGWRDLFGIDEEKYSFSNIKTGVHPVKVVFKNKRTIAPPRYTESSFLSKIEKEGIGRPSTYATILDTIQKRKYVILKSKQLIPTKEGFDTITFLEEFFPEFIDLSYTKNMEKELDQIANGKQNSIVVLKSFWKTLKEFLEIAEKSIDSKLSQKYGECPKCGKPLAKRKGKYGDFYGCTGFPKCKYIGKKPNVSSDKQMEVFNNIKKQYGDGTENE